MNPIGGYIFEALMLLLLGFYIRETIRDVREERRIRKGQR